MHDVEITYFKVNGEQEGKRFVKGKIDRAIDEFLLGVPANQEIQINVEFS